MFSFQSSKFSRASLEGQWHLALFHRAYSRRSFRGNLRGWKFSPHWLARAVVRVTKKPIQPGEIREDEIPLKDLAEEIGVCTETIRRGLAKGTLSHFFTRKIKYGKGGTPTTVFLRSDITSIREVLVDSKFKAAKTMTLGRKSKFDFLGIIWNFSRTALSGHKVVVVANQAGIECLDQETGQKYSISFSEEGQIMLSEKVSYCVEGEVVNIYRGPKPTSVNFWTVFLLNKLLADSKRVSLPFFSSRLSQLDKLYTEAVVGPQGKIALEFEGKEVFLWSKKLRSRQGQKVLLIKAGDLLMAFDPKMRRVGVFRWDKALGRFYQRRISNGQEVRSYIVVINHERCFSYGNLTLFFGDRAKAGSICLVDQTDKGKVVRVSNQLVNYEYPLVRIIDKDQVQGYILAPELPCKKTRLITGLIDREIGLSRAKAGKTCYVFGQQYFISRQQLRALGPGRVAAVLPVVEDDKLVAVINPNNFKRIDFPIFRKANGEIVAVGRVAQGIEHKGRMIVEGLKTSISRSVFGELIEGVAVGNDNYSLGLSITNPRAFNPRDVSLVIDFDMTVNGEGGRVVYFSLANRFSPLETELAFSPRDGSLSSLDIFRGHHLGRRLVLARKIALDLKKTGGCADRFFFCFISNCRK